MTDPRDRDPRDLYREHILEHSKHPRSEGRLEGHTHAHTESNPLCGDRVTVQLVLDGEGRIEDLRFKARGCAISVAAVSMMTEWVRGLGPGELAHLRAQVSDAVPPGGPEVPPPVDALVALRAFPTRERCATLAWDTLLAALDHPVNAQ